MSNALLSKGQVKKEKQTMQKPWDKDNNTPITLNTFKGLIMPYMFL